MDERGDGGGIDDPPLQPVYPIETLLTAFSGGTVMSTIRSLLGLAARGAAGSTADDIAQSIEDYLGGSPDRAFSNDAGDTILMRGDQKIRFDINNSHDCAPHFHIETLDSSGKWVDSGDEHMYFFDQE